MTTPHRRHTPETTTLARSSAPTGPTVHSGTQPLDWHARWCRLGDQMTNLGQLAAVLTLALTIAGLITLTALTLT